MKNTKTALLTASLAMLLCVAMLVGTTFAWFTDTASANVNKIQAGTLDIQILNAQDQEVSTLNWVTKDNRAQTAILWEPGATYTLEQFKIKNNGNLAMKFKFEIVGLSGDAKLMEVIDFSYTTGNKNPYAIDKEYKLAAGAATELITLTAHMQETAGNDYMNLSIPAFFITVSAVQDTVEYDSFTNEYDKSAAYSTAKTYSAASQEDLENIARNIKQGDTISITGDFTMTKIVRFTTNNITLEGNGHTITSDREVDVSKTLFAFGEDGKWCQNITVQNINFDGEGGRVFHFHGGDSSTLNNVTIKGEFYLAVNFFGTHGATLNNCDFKSTATEKHASATVFANQQSANQLILNNTTIDDIYVNVSNNDASTLPNNGVKVVVNSGSSIGTMYLPDGTTLVPYSTNGGTIGNISYLQ